jgi:hypothetical protein
LLKHYLDILKLNLPEEVKKEIDEWSKSK